MSPKEVCALIVAALMATFALRYGYQTYKREITPTLSTWVLFLAGVGLSLVSYLFEEKWDVISGINNSVDILVVLAVIASILLWGDRTVRFRPWEKWYLAAAALVVVYTLVTGDWLGSNLLSQGLIVVGTISTMHTIVAEGRNTESFTAWGLVWFAHAAGLIPSYVEGGNLLASVYVIRGLVSISVTLGLMTYYHFRPRPEPFRWTWPWNRSY